METDASRRDCLDKRFSAESAQRWAWHPPRVTRVVVLRGEDAAREGNRLDLVTGTPVCVGEGGSRNRTSRVFAIRRWERRGDATG